MPEYSRQYVQGYSLQHYISLQKEKPKTTSVGEKVPYGMYAHIRNQYRETMKNWSRLYGDMKDV